MTSEVITRFAPSPTGYLHVGNTRTALINFLYARKYKGKFILRIDDTDTVRNKNQYKEAIIRDLTWLELNWDIMFEQSKRTECYEAAKQKLINTGRLYPCYETPEELEIKRKIRLSSGKPPIYDRAGLALTEKQKQDYENQGRKPHYRFLINDGKITWHDMIKGQINYHGTHLGDPVIIRADGSMTYMLCSTVDDIDYNITEVIRGEDHISNTAIQIQMFEALGRTPPNFGHLSLVKAKDEKISKREGGFEISSLREKEYLQPMAVNSFFALIGSSRPVTPYKTISDLIDNFDISTYSKSPTTFIPDELKQINHKMIISYEYQEIQESLAKIGASMIDKRFWEAVRPNLNTLTEIKDWWKICFHPERPEGLDQSLLKIAAETLPGEINTNTWQDWTKKISYQSGKKGKELFLPLRLALTGKKSGPELKDLLPLLTREQILTRLGF